MLETRSYIHLNHTFNPENPCARNIYVHNGLAFDSCRGQHNANHGLIHEFSKEGVCIGGGGALFYNFRLGLLPRELYIQNIENLPKIGGAPSERAVHLGRAAATIII